MKVEELNKAAGGLGSHFGKAASMHKAAASHHESLHKHHSEMASFSKGKHDAMDDGHEMKAYMAKAAEHHTAKAAHHLELHKLHKAHSEECETMGKTFDADKAAGAAPAAPAATPTNKAAGSEEPAAAAAAAAAGNDAGDGVAALINKTTDSLVAKALEALNTDPKVAERIQQIVLDRVNAALGDKIQPTHVRGVLPDVPGSARLASPQLVPRPGQPIQEESAPPELAGVFGE